MALRDVLIKLRLDDSQFRAKMAAAAASTRKFGAETATAGAQGTKSLGLLRSNYATIGLVAGAAGVAFVKSAAQFEQAMANVNATGAASRSELAALEQQALEFGRTTVYSSTEAAGGIEALLKAGISARDVMGKTGGLAASLDLAAASNLDVAQSAEAVSIAMQQFNVAGKDASHVADLLAAGAGKSVGEVSDLSMALNQSGLVARTTGLSIEETVGALSAFAAAGLIGSDAGTSFKTMLQRLAKPTAEAGALMEELGISAYDAQGNFVGLAEFAGTLETGLAGMSQEQRQATLATIFGSDAVRAATLLYQQGEGGIKKWTGAVDDAGYAADVAAKKTDTLSGDLDKMKNSWKALAEGAGTGGGLRPMIQGFGDLADAIVKVNKALDDASDKLFGDRGEGFTANDNMFEALANTLKIREAANMGVPAEVFIKFKTQGAADAIRDAVAVATAANLTPEEVRSALHLIGWDAVGIDTVLTKMNQVDAKDVVSTLNLLGVDATLADLNTVDAELDETGAKNPRPRVDLDNLDPSLEGIANVLGGLYDIDEQEPEATITINADDALDSISRVLSGLGDISDEAISVRDMLSGLPERPAGGGAIENGHLVRFAHGGRARGAMRGPGGPRQDRIPALLSNGEHVLTASDVRKAGGQEAIYKMRSDIQAGRLRFAAGGHAKEYAAAPARSFAAGGSVDSGANRVQISFRDFSIDVEKMSASIRVVATDEAGNVLREAMFESGMRA